MLRWSQTPSILFKGATCLAQSPSIQTAFADVNGARLYYEDAGEGHPLVFVHAGIADSRMWDGQFAAFAGHNRVIRYDLRGFGKSKMVRGDFSHTRDLLALLDFLNVDSAYIVGCSMGGGTAIDLALAYPERVAALITVCSSPFGFKYEGEQPPLSHEIAAAYEAGDLERASENEVRLWVDGPSRTSDQVPAAIRDLVREMNLIALQNEAAEPGDNQPIEPSAANRLGEINVPSLVIIGELDNPKAVVSGEWLASHIPGAQRVVMATAHLPSMEQPAEFNRVVMEFLRSIAAPARNGGGGR
jgi:3-oxoadipate enol-lactonase